MQACREDDLYFFNSFCWCYEPRPRFANGIELPRKIPFISWPHQEPLIQEIRESLGLEDIAVEKSRGEGLSWIGTLFAVSDFVFRPYSSIGMISKDKDSVDSIESTDSLFWKMDKQLDWLPNWMTGIKGRDFLRLKSSSTLFNSRTGATITGFAATGDAASGGRKTWMLCDELAKFPRPQDEEVMASTQHVTDSRFIVSTPKGAAGAYYTLMHAPSGALKKLRVHWSSNPTKNRGLYRVVNNRAVAIDPEGNPLPQEYQDNSSRIIDLWARLRRRGFKLEDKDRSPWYDRECDRAQATPQNIAQELDLDYGGSSYLVFGAEMLAKMASTVTVPLHVGDVDYFDDGRDLTFSTIDGGPMKLWCPLEFGKTPPRSSYFFGADISTGIGGTLTSNSSLVGFDATSGEQVFEFAAPTIEPKAFALLSIAVCSWFHGALLNWETNGPGRAYTKAVLDNGYSNIYYRESLSRKRRERTREAGWTTTTDSKEVLASEMSSAVLLEDVIVRSKWLSDEFRNYVRINGKITHALIANAMEDGKGVSHGDRAIGAMVAVAGLRSRPDMRNKDANEDKKNPPKDTLAARVKQWKLQDKPTSRWDNRTLSQCGSG